MVRRGMLEQSVPQYVGGAPSYESMVDTRYSNTVLSPGIVFTDRELQSIFGMNEDGAASTEFRSTGGREHPARSRCRRWSATPARDADLVRGDVMTATSVEAGATILADHLRMLADADPGRAQILRAEADRAIRTR